MKLLLLVGGLLLTSSATAAMPNWQELEFEHQVMWLTARSSVRLSPSPQTGDSAWELFVSSAAGNSEESVHIKFDPATGASYRQVRFSRGTDKRFKRHQFDASDAGTRVIARERYVPGPRAAPDSLEGWDLTSRRLLPYPALPDGAVLASPYTLLVLAEQVLEQADKSMQVYVHTDLNTYLVELSATTEESINVDYQVTGTGKAAGDEARVIRVNISSTAWGKLADKPDFNLMGLTGDISIMLDLETRLPLEVRGQVPRLGMAVLKLKSASLRESAR